MARGQQATLLNGMSGLTFRTNLNNMFNDLYGPSMSLQTTIWVDPNRIDSYTADGSIQFPYKSLGGAFTALNTSNLPGVVINIASSTYTESSQVTVPTTLQGPVVINGNGATITFSIGFTVPNLFGFPAYIYGLNFGTTASVYPPSPPHICTIQHPKPYLQRLGQSLHFALYHGRRKGPERRRAPRLDRRDGRRKPFHRGPPTLHLHHQGRASQTRHVSRQQHLRGGGGGGGGGERGEAGEWIEKEGKDQIRGLSSGFCTK